MSKRPHCSRIRRVKRFLNDHKTHQYVACYALDARDPTVCNQADIPSRRPKNTFDIEPYPTDVQDKASRKMSKATYLIKCCWSACVFHILGLE